MARARPKTFASPLESLVRRRAGELDRQTPRPKGLPTDTEATRRHAAQRRQRDLEARARAELPAIVLAQTAKFVGRVEGETDDEHDARVSAVASGRLAGLSPARAAAEHAATLRRGAPRSDTAPPTPRDPSVTRAGRPAAP
jgi:hypothetical protein